MGIFPPCRKKKVSISLSFNLYQTLSSYTSGQFIFLKKKKKISRVLSLPGFHAIQRRSHFLIIHSSPANPIRLDCVNWPKTFSHTVLRVDFNDSCCRHSIIFSHYHPTEMALKVHLYSTRLTRLYAQVPSQAAFLESSCTATSLTHDPDKWKKSQ